MPNTIDILVNTLPPSYQQPALTALNLSQYLAKQFSQQPDRLDFCQNSFRYRETELEQIIQQDIATCQDENQLLERIRHIRNREMCRIAWRDLCDLSPLTETMRDTSDLASSLVDATMQWWFNHLTKKHGFPCNVSGEVQTLNIIGMGKLGGRELNFSSDIDLMFTYPEEGQTNGRVSIDNQMFFTRLGQKLISSLSKSTAHGIAYRVDMRLRPFGQSGPLAISFDAMEHYYQTHGREWERYAMIKGRIIAGDAAQGKLLMQRLKPFIYRRYLDYGAVENLRDMKALINQQAKQKGKVNDIKLGSGGIREVEFIAQVFQLMRGGRLSALQHSSLITTLESLAELELINTSIKEQLLAAYHFLRRVENRLQMINDQQTHELPSDAQHYQNLSAAMGFDNTADFNQALQHHRDNVSQQFNDIFSVPRQTDEAHHDQQEVYDQLWANINDELAVEQLFDNGFKQAQQSHKALADLHNSRLYTSLTDTGRKRLDTLIPKLLKLCLAQKQPDLALARSLKVIERIASRSGYIAMLADNPNAFTLLVTLVSKSVWITHQLSRTPILLDELMDAEQLFQPLNKQDLQTALNFEMQQVDSDDTEQIMERLRQFKQAQVLRVAATDIVGEMPLMKVSDQLTWIAEAILQTTLDIAYTQLSQKHGEPSYIDNINQSRKTAQFAVVGYGKLGGIELGYGSDIDIVFIHDSQGEQQTTNGAKPIDNALFFARLAQRCIHFLNTFTASGRLYETDTRLRPGGNSGLMVSQIDAYADYQIKQAWTWEHQALVRARGVAGHTQLIKQFETIRSQVLTQQRDHDQLKHDIVSMRKKMWQTLASHSEGNIDIKKDPGGITDLEFIVQYLVLKYAHQHPALCHYSDNIRLLDSLAQTKLISTTEEQVLSKAYKALRDEIHALSLQDQPSSIPINLLPKPIERIKQSWQHYFS